MRRVETATRLAARALARGEALRALQCVGRAEDPAGLMLRGIAYAQIGELDMARVSLSRAAKGATDDLMRARISAALLEIELLRGRAAHVAREARVVATELERLGDARNAGMQRIVVARAETLRGSLGEARAAIDEVLADERQPADVRAVAALAQAEIAVRDVAPSRAQDMLGRLARLLASAHNELLARAAAALERELSAPVARLLEGGSLREVDLFAIERASRGDRLVVDACRRTVSAGRASIPLVRRPVLFALALSLARAYPAAAAREGLVRDAFGARRADESHRARLRVEIGRLRGALAGLAGVEAAREGYRLVSDRPVVVLLPLTDDEAARVGLLLADGAAWTARALAEHCGRSTRTVQRALASLVESGRAVRIGSGRNLAYASTQGRTASRLLLLALVPRA